MGKGTSHTLRSVSELWLVPILQHHLLLTARGNLFRSTYATLPTIHSLLPCLFYTHACAHDMGTHNPKPRRHEHPASLTLLLSGKNTISKMNHVLIKKKIINIWPTAVSARGVQTKHLQLNNKTAKHTYVSVYLWSFSFPVAAPRVLFLLNIGSFK